MEPGRKQRNHALLASCKLLAAVLDPLTQIRYGFFPRPARAVDLAVANPVEGLRYAPYGFAVSVLSRVRLVDALQC